MLDVLVGFVEELRASGLPVSVTETIDAADAVGVIPLDDRGQLRAALAATLVKSAEHAAAFARVFDLYFSVRLPSQPHAGDSDVAAAPFTPVHDAHAHRDAPDEVRARVAEALRSGERASLVAAARLAVATFAAVDAARPVGPAYYVHKTLRALDLDALVAGLCAASEEDGIDGRLAAFEIASRADTLRELIADDVARALVAERGSAAVAKSTRRPLLDDVDFMHASADELARMRRAIVPLARVLAARLVHRRRHRRRGPLDVRATIRRSLSTGGVPVEPRFRTPHPSRPEIFLLADVSGSVSAFARFTVHLVYAISEQFSRVRSAVFIDGVDEVTSIFQRARAIDDAIAEVATQADVVDAHGHSNYGNALRSFAEQYGPTIGPGTTLIVLGDARGNYHPGEPQVLRTLSRRVRHLYWLNPEPRSYWGTGDSIIGEYAPYCDGVFECRTLRQLKAFVDYLA